MSGQGMRFVLTGAARGIGRAMAERLARDSVQRHGAPARMVLAALHGDELEAFAQVLRADGAEVKTVVADMAEAAAARRIIDAAEAFGGLEAVVSNAGFAIPSALLDAEVDDWDKLFAVHVRAAWLLGKHAHPLLKAARGSIVVTTSISASNATPPLAAYAPSKAAALMLVRQMALPIDIVGGETLRADDGLALSSRNGYLSATERARALELHHALAAARDALRSGDRDFARIEHDAMAFLEARGWSPQYVAVRHKDPRIFITGFFYA